MYGIRDKWKSRHREGSAKANTGKKFDYKEKMPWKWSATWKGNKPAVKQSRQNFEFKSQNKLNITWPIKDKTVLNYLYKDNKVMQTVVPW